MSDIINKNEFSIHLPSNACAKLFPYNTASDFSVQFDDPIRLSNGQWSCALSNISYPTSIHTIGREEIQLTYPSVYKFFSKAINDNNDGQFRWNNFKTYQIKQPPYSKVKGVGYFLRDVCANIMEKCKPEDVVIQFLHRNPNRTLFDEVPAKTGKLLDSKFTYKIQIDIRNPKLFLQFSPKLTTLLGFPRKVSFFRPKVYIAYINPTKHKNIKQFTDPNDWRMAITELPNFINRKEVILKTANEKVPTLKELQEKWEKAIDTTKCNLSVQPNSGQVSIQKLTPFSNANNYNIIEVNDQFALALGYKKRSRLFGLADLYISESTYLYEKQLIDGVYIKSDIKPEVFDKHVWKVIIYETTLSPDDEWLEKNFTSITLPSKTYSLPSHLINDIQDKIDTTLNRKRKAIKFALTQDKKVTINVKPLHSILMDNHLKELFGFPQTHLFEQDLLSEKKYTGSYPININRPLHSLSIFTNITGFVHVGAHQQPLLRSFLHDTSIKEAVVMKEFLHNIYVPVVDRVISHIDIKICDDNLQPIPFSAGKTIIVLHFLKS